MNQKAREVDIEMQTQPCDSVAASLMQIHSKSLRPVACVNRVHGSAILNDTPQERNSDDEKLLGSGTGGVKKEEGPCQI